MKTFLEILVATGLIASITVLWMVVAFKTPARDFLINNREYITMAELMGKYISRDNLPIFILHADGVFPDLIITKVSHLRYSGSIKGDFVAIVVAKNAKDFNFVRLLSELEYGG